MQTPTFENMQPLAQLIYRHMPDGRQLHQGIILSLPNNFADMPDPKKYDFLRLYYSTILFGRIYQHQVINSHRVFECGFHADRNKYGPSDQAIFGWFNLATLTKLGEMTAPSENPSGQARKPLYCYTAQLFGLDKPNNRWYYLVFYEDLKL